MIELQEMYTLIILFCGAITTWVLSNIRKVKDSQTSNLIFERLVYSLLALLLIDLGWIFIDGKSGTAFRIANCIINILYMSIMGFLSYSWFNHIAFGVYGKATTKPTWNYVTSIPLLILIALSLLSIRYNLIFTIDENNNYARGPLHPIQQGICYLYYLSACFLLVRSRIKKHTHYQHRHMGSNAVYALLPIAGGILCYIFTSLPTPEVFITLAIACFYGNAQVSLITQDPLTGVHNKQTIDKIVADSVGFQDDKHKLFITLVDINDFQRINENYGHTEGDEILVQTADILKKITTYTDAQIGRLGADEFIILRKFWDSTQAEIFKSEIESAILDTNNHIDRPFKVSASVGFNEADTKSYESLNESIKNAEKMLSEEKKKLHVLDKSLD